MQNSIDEFYRFTARLFIQEKEKFIVLKYASSLSPYIQQEMEFLTVTTLTNAFHYAGKLEAKQKGKSHFTNKPTSRTSDKKSPANSNKFKIPSQQTSLKPNHQKKNFQKDKRDHSRQNPTRKWCDYHSTSWYDTLE